LILFGAIMLGAGTLYYFLSMGTDYPLQNLAEAVYFALTLTFLQPIYAFPSIWYLQVFYFVMPIMGIGTLALGLAEFGTLFFNRRTRGKEWQMAVASTFSNHIVLIGLGHLGYRVVTRLNEMGLDVVVIEINPRAELREAILRLDVPLIEEDGTRESILEAAGIRRARTIMLCTQNDSLNLEVALKARSLKPDIEVVVRIFDDGFADLLHKQFGFRALSATGMAAPIFAASAANIDITPPVLIEGKPHLLARLVVAPKSLLAGLTVNQAEEKFHTSLILLARSGTQTFHPAGMMTIHHGDSLAFFGTPEDIRALIHENR
jgi:Trk K+ transport system NAD-binding subunit